ncbi:MAG: DUF108 domain-containing protein [Proteobacteria bacterium]|nr:DUF108 domain-containing protein [Pseudomonadota bacterium]
MRIGIIGYGYIGRYLTDRIMAPDSGMDVAFVYNRSGGALDNLAPEYCLTALGDAAARHPDIIVEVAHPSVTQQHGADIFACSDYMPLSVTALTDDVLRGRLLASAKKNGHRLILGAGALIGGEALAMRPDAWERVRITFRKHPDNIDFADSGFDASEITGKTVLYDGPARGIGEKFPRNVNTMITCALVSTGLDACEACLICDPDLDVAIAEVEAWGKDGGYVRTEKRQPAVGVSGTEMLDSVWFSLVRAAGSQKSGYELL